VDNGAAYRSNTLQGICARLGIQLIHCRPYSPESKGKLERWHRTFRDQFLGELDTRCIADLADLNARLWAWIEAIYHQRPHTSLQGVSPLQRYQQDLTRIRTLGQRAARLDELFYHRVTRKVRRDGTVAYQGKRFEVPYELAGKSIQLVIEPHEERLIELEDHEGKTLGKAIELDVIANNQRARRKPEPQQALPQTPHQGPNLVEIAHQHYHGTGITNEELPLKKDLSDHEEH